MEREEIIVLRNMLRDEAEAISRYTEAAFKVSNPQLKQLLTDIREEEKVHVGELKQALETLFGIKDEFKEDEGRDEAKEILNPVQRAYSAFDTINNIHNNLFN